MKLQYITLDKLHEFYGIPLGDQKGGIKIGKVYQYYQQKANLAARVFEDYQLFKKLETHILEQKIIQSIESPQVLVMNSIWYNCKMGALNRLMNVRDSLDRHEATLLSDKFEEQQFLLTRLQRLYNLVNMLKSELGNDDFQVVEIGPDPNYEGSFPEYYINIIPAFLRRIDPEYRAIIDRYRLKNAWTPAKAATLVRAIDLLQWSTYHTKEGWPTDCIQYFGLACQDRNMRKHLNNVFSLPVMHDDIQAVVTELRGTN